MYREEQSGASFMLGVITGAFVGAGVALLFAPKTGQEMRQQLGEQYRGLADRVTETTQTLRENADTLRQQGRERVQQLTGQLSDRASAVIDRASSVAERWTGERQTTTAPTASTDRFPSSAPSV
jgi:gas vesicle protein